MIEPLVRLYQRRQFPVIKVLKKIKNTLNGLGVPARREVCEKCLAYYLFFYSFKRL
jgi:hypothetical protein